MKKYELTDNTIEHNGIFLYQIRALKNFGIVRAGKLGGYVQSAYNLSQDGNCWIYNNAKVFDISIVGENAKVYGDAIIYGNSFIYGDAQIFENSKVCGNVQIYGNAEIYGYAEISGDTEISGNAEIFFDVNSNNDFMVLGQFGVVNRYVTVNLKEKKIVCGCFYGTFDKFEAAVNEKYNGNGNYYTLIKFLKTL